MVCHERVPSDSPHIWQQIPRVALKSPARTRSWSHFCTFHAPDSTLMNDPVPEAVSTDLTQLSSFQEHRSSYILKPPRLRDRVWVVSEPATLAVTTIYFIIHAWSRGTVEAPGGITTTILYSPLRHTTEKLRLRKSRFGWLRLWKSRTRFGWLRLRKTQFGWLRASEEIPIRFGWLHLVAF